MNKWENNKENDSFFKYINLNEFNIDELLKYGKISKQGRARYCLHKDNQSKFQTMIIYHDKRTLNPIHRHLNSDEDFILINGRINYKYYDNFYNCINSHTLDSNISNNGITTQKNILHNIELLTDYIIFIETVKYSYEENIS
jgi:cupin fold WbuC family metalloprotein